MLGLSGTLSIASQALAADTGAIGITNNNISNVNTPGYSRQLVDLSADAVDANGTSQDNGVSFGGFTSVRDEVLQIGIHQKISDSSSLNTQSASWSQIETAFSSTTSGVGASLSAMFSALSALSTSPTSSSLRQSALSAATQVVDEFHQAASTLSTAQASANASVSGSVAQINQLTSQIASLNGQLSQMQASGQDGGNITDTRDNLIGQLAQLAGISSITTESSPTLSLSNGSPLVMGDTSYPLQVTKSADGMNHVVDSQGQDVTSDLTDGSLGGALTMRNQSIPQLSSTLDQLAGQFASAINAAQAQGYDQNGNAGQPLFAIPSTGSAASGISVAIASGASLALSSDGTPGSSGNLANLLAVQNQNLPAGQTPTDTYASLVQTIGNSSAAVTSNLNATSAALTQLTNQQSSESGVSIDEETTNLLQYQQAYSAAAKVISTINDLYSIVLNMNTVTG